MLVTGCFLSKGSVLPCLPIPGLGTLCLSPTPAWHLLGAGH